MTLLRWYLIQQYIYEWLLGTELRVITVSNASCRACLRRAFLSSILLALSKQPLLDAMIRLRRPRLLLLRFLRFLLRLFRLLLLRLEACEWRFDRHDTAVNALLTVAKRCRRCKWKGGDVIFTNICQVVACVFLFWNPPRTNKRRLTVVVTCFAFS